MVIVVLGGVYYECFLVFVIYIKYRVVKIMVVVIKGYDLSLNF